MDHYSSYSFDVCIDGKKVNEYYHRDENVYIEGRRGSEFTLKFKNKTYEKVLVVLSVDGLSVMDGKPAGEKAGGYICDGYGTIDIPGWRLDKNKVAKFEFRPSGDRDNKTYVEELASEGFDVDTGNQGVIGIMVFRQKAKPPVYQAVHHYHHYEEPWAYPKGVFYGGNGIGYGYASGLVPASNMVYNSNASNVRSASLSSIQCSATASAALPQSVSTPTSNFVGLNAVEETSLGTGFGDDATFKTSQVEFERDTSPVWTGSIFYDTKRGLQARGVVIDRVVVKTPNAFPASLNSGCYVPKTRR